MKKLRIRPDPDSVCTGYRYKLITDSAESGYELITDSAESRSYLYRIPVQISYKFGKIRILQYLCSRYWYQFFTDLAGSGTYLYRIPVRIDYGFRFGRIWS
jgi:hypothetical protein